MSPPASLGHPESLDDLLLYRISRLLAAAGAMVIRYCEGEFGITRRESRVLGLLVGRKEGGGPLGSCDLALPADLDRPRTSKAVSALVRKKLVSRVPRPRDARHVSLAPTAEGEALYRPLVPRCGGHQRQNAECAQRRASEPVRDVEAASGQRPGQAGTGDAGFGRRRWRRQDGRPPRATSGSLRSASFSRWNGQTLQKAWRPARYPRAEQPFCL